MKTYILLILAILVISCSSEVKKCSIIGEVIGRKSNAILLFKASEFPLYETEIPVLNGGFNYSFKFTQPEVYLLIFKEEFQKGSMKEIPFFSERGQIKFTLYPGNDSKGYVVKGHDLNKALIDYYQLLRDTFLNEILKYTDSIHAMYNDGTVYNKEYRGLEEQIKKTTDKQLRSQLLNDQKNLTNAGSVYNPKAKEYGDIQDSIEKEQKRWKLDYIDKNTTLLSFYFFMKDIQEIAKSIAWREAEAALINKAQRNLDRFSAEFPDHPYRLIIKNSLDGLLNIHEGGRFIDFTAADLKGESASLSDIIKSNKLTLVSFWSTVCGPCIKTNHELIPVYKEYKGKGFEIAGIPQAFGNVDNMMSVVRKENYPWPNLIDKDNKTDVQEKYNLPYLSGATFLINSSGKIIAVNLTAANLKEKLIELLK